MNDFTIMRGGTCSVPPRIGIRIFNMYKKVRAPKAEPSGREIFKRYFEADL